MGVGEADQGKGGLQNEIAVCKAGVEWKHSLLGINH